MEVLQYAKIGQSIDEATFLLNKNQVVAIPTETVYGLAGNALNTAAVVKIFEAKNRPSFDPLIVHVSDFSEFEKYAVTIPQPAKALFKSVGPGPITYILQKKAIIPDLVTSGLGTVGLRVPNHNLTLRLLRQLSFPVAAPSANPFGYVSPTTPLHVFQQLKTKIPYILDGGPCAVGIESTIIDFTGKHPKILRLGGMDSDYLTTILGPDLEISNQSSSKPSAPGMLLSHYAPSKPVFIESLSEVERNYKIDDIGVLAFGEYLDGVPKENQLNLSPTKDLNEAARNLFAHLRQFEKMDIRAIYAPLLPEKGLGKGINDRLRRAAHKSSTSQ